MATQDEGQDDVTNTTIQDFTYPDGGLQAWLIVLGAWCGMTGGLGITNSIAPFQQYIGQNQLAGRSEGDVGLIFSLNLFFTFFGSIIIGPIFDAIGPRLLVLAGSVCIVASLILLGEGIGSSLLFTPSIAVVGHYFFRKRAFATGIAMTGSSMGGIIFPLVFNAVLAQSGFAWATRTLGLIVLFLVAIANLLLRGRLPKSHISARTLLPDLRIFADGTGCLAFCTAGLFFMELALFVPLAYLTSYSVAHGISESFSYQLIAIFNAASVLGRALPGFIADKVGRYNTMLAMLVLCAVSTFCIWLPASPTDTILPLVILYAVVFGFASGSNLSLTGPCVGQLCETTHFGRYYSACYAIVSFATLIGIPIAGQLIKANDGEYFGVIAFTGAGYVVSTLCMLFVRVVKVGWGVSAVF
ncbi:hypothetical protein Q7P37_001092 [Cladosporium fusiforme]